MSTATEADTRWFRELDAANIEAYTVLLYETWIGDRNDPATQVEEWMSMFLEEDLPEEYSTARDQSDVPPYVADSRYSYRHSYHGLKGAMVNEMLRVVQEGDRDAARHRQEEQSLTGDSYYARSSSVAGVQLEDFFAAVERVAADDSDEEAWATIDKWRSRQLRRDEGGNQ